MLFRANVKIRVRTRFSVWLVSGYAHVLCALGCNCHAGACTAYIICTVNISKVKMVQRTAKFSDTRQPALRLQGIRGLDLLYAPFSSASRACSVSDSIMGM